jgi:hypothetical protein
MSSSIREMEITADATASSHSLIVLRELKRCGPIDGQIVQLLRSASGSAREIWGKMRAMCRL